MARGVLTDEVKEVSKELMGYEITQQELRLMPYLFSRLLDNAGISRESINRDENRILNEWEKKGFIVIESSFDKRMVYVSKEFYETLSKILMVGYVSGMIVEPVS